MWQRLRTTSCQAPDGHSDTLAGPSGPTKTSCGVRTVTQKKLSMDIRLASNSDTRHSCEQLRLLLLPLISTDGLSRGVPATPDASIKVFSSWYAVYIAPGVKSPRLSQPITTARGHDATQPVHNFRMPRRQPCCVAVCQACTSTVVLVCAAPSLQDD
jgi:hypothetical protein